MPRSRRRLSRAAFGVPVLLALALSGAACLRPRATVVPIPTLRFETPGSGHRCLVVLLPGRRDEPADFETQGFVSLLRQSGARCDALAVDSHLGYFAERSIVERLHADVVAPARARGYDQIWLAGISLGGLGSLLYLRDHPEEVSGALLIAPYLGEPEVIDEIRTAGGLVRWERPARPGVGGEVWSFLRQALVHPEADRLRLPPLYLGYGTGDGFAPACRLLAAELPTERVYTARGGHDWPPWRAVWKAFLGSGALPGTGP